MYVYVYIYIYICRFICLERERDMRRRGGPASSRSRAPPLQPSITDGIGPPDPSPTPLVYWCRYYKSANVTFV